jgi:cytochrome c-type biogenesis protein CcmH/NrfF
VSRHTAIEAFLLGQPSLLRVCRQQLILWVLCHLSTIAMMAVISLLIVRHHVPVNYRAAITFLLYGPVVGVNTVAGCVARGSRRLWLRSGESRAMLYNIAARVAWHALALLGIPLFGLALVEIRFLPPAQIDLWFPLAICVTLTPCALYLGLLNFQRRLNLSFLALYVVAGSAYVASLYVQSAQGRELLWIAPVVFLAIGGVLRNVARRRWCGIDWLRFRAERETSPFAVRRS